VRPLTREEEQEGEDRHGISDERKIRAGRLGQGGKLVQKLEAHEVAWRLFGHHDKEHQSCNNPSCMGYCYGKLLQT
jgi:hypothetical protein